LFDSGSFSFSLYVPGSLLLDLVLCLFPTSHAELFVAFFWVPDCHLEAGPSFCLVSVFLLPKSCICHFFFFLPPPRITDISRHWLTFLPFCPFSNSSRFFSPSGQLLNPQQGLRQQVVFPLTLHHLLFDFVFAINPCFFATRCPTPHGVRSCGYNLDLFSCSSPFSWIYGFIWEFFPQLRFSAVSFSRPPGILPNPPPFSVDPKPKDSEKKYVILNCRIAFPLNTTPRWCPLSGIKNSGFHRRVPATPEVTFPTLIFPTPRPPRLRIFTSFPRLTSVTEFSLRGVSHIFYPIYSTLSHSPAVTPSFLATLPPLLSRFWF